MSTSIERNSRKEFIGKVTGAKMDKSIVVSVERNIKHLKYGKYFKKTKKLYAHDEENACGLNDIVRIQETRPLSKLKRWRLIEIIEKAK
jgi:small subunit ribosomal protein S17